MSIFKEISFFVRMPISYNITILHNNRIKKTILVVGLLAKPFSNHMMSALITYQIFVIRR